MDTNKELYNYIKKHDINAESVNYILEQTGVTKTKLLRKLFDSLTSLNSSIIKNDYKVIYKTISLICYISQTTEFNKEEVEINKKRIKKVRNILLTYLRYNDNEYIKNASNKLDEIVLDKKIVPESLNKIIKELIDNKTNVSIIKKIININKKSILHNNCELFNYAFEKINDSNSEVDNLYYLTLLKICHSSKIDSILYLKECDKMKNSQFYGELYNIILGYKRYLSLKDVEKKYGFKQNKLIYPIHNSFKRLCDTNPIITIDPNNCSTKDDAFSIIKSGNNYIVSIYITDVASNITHNSKLDVLAKNNFKNMYLKNTIYPNYSKEVSEQLSLNKGVEKPAIILTIVFDSNIEIKDYYITNKICKITYNLTYDNCDLIFNGKKKFEYQKQLEEIYNIAKYITSNCDSKGNYWQKKQENKPYENMYSSKSHLIIAQLSTLYNILLGKIAYYNNAPYIYRCQDKPLIISSMERENLNLDPETSNIINSIYGESYYSDTPKMHYGLKEDIYTHSSSPARRYTDLYNQRLLHKYILKDIDFDDKDYLNIIKYCNESEIKQNLFEEEYNRQYTLEKKRRTK